MAGKFPQKGEIVGDPATKVSLRVKTEGNDPISVANFEAEDVATRCDGEMSRIDFTVLDAVPVSEDNTFKARLTDGEGGVFRLKGKVKNDGRATVGSLKTNNFESDDGNVCKTPKQKFKTSF